MTSPCCKVSIIFTAEDTSAHIEESGRPNSLVYAIEQDGGQIASVLRRVYGFVSTRSVSSIDLHFPLAMPAKRRDAAVRLIALFLRELLKPR